MSTSRFDSDSTRRNSGFTDAQKLLIKKRDGFECQQNCDLTRHCGKRFLKPDEQIVLSVHHIISRQKCREQGIDPNTLGNGITLCEPFHMSLHRRHCGKGLNWNPTHDEDLRDTVLRSNNQLLSGRHEGFRPCSRPLTIRKMVAKIFGGWGNLGLPRH